MDTIRGPPLTYGTQNAGASSEDNPCENIHKGHRNTETPYIPWNNSPLQKNPTAEFGFEPDTSLKKGSIESSGRILYVLFV